MDKAAVDNLNIKMQESQITCLLGHNGAGKSTTINMLTGLYPPSKGDCFIYGRRLSSELDTLRQRMSICPQHSVLFADLSVAEHISFFTRIKGILPSKEYVQERATEVGLEEKLNAASKHLSGGMKRKLSIAIAFCGDPNFVLLDEVIMKGHSCTQRIPGGLCVHWSHLIILCLLLCLVIHGTLALIPLAY